MKRFWSTAETTASTTGFIILLDDKPVKKPSGAVLALPFRSLAEAIADEWRKVQPAFIPSHLPLTQLAITAQDRMATARPAIITPLAAYGLNDLLCYRAAEPALASWQHTAWQPWLDWAAATHGLHLLVTTGITPITQPPETCIICETILEAFDDYTLAACGIMVPALGSLVLALAAATGYMDAATATALSSLDEQWQERQWGQDEDAAMKRHAIQQDIALCQYFMQLCRP